MPCKRMLYTLKSVTPGTADMAQKEILDQAVKSAGFPGAGFQKKDVLSLGWRSPQKP